MGFGMFDGSQIDGGANCWGENMDLTRLKVRNKRFGFRIGVQDFKYWMKFKITLNFYDVKFEERPNRTKLKFLCFL